MDLNTILPKGTRVRLPYGELYSTGIGSMIMPAAWHIYGTVAEDCPIGEPIVKVLRYTNQIIYAGRLELRADRSVTVFYPEDGQGSYVHGDIAVYDPDMEEPETNTPGIEYACKLADVNALLYFIHAHFPRGWHITDGRIVDLEEVA